MKTEGGTRGVWEQTLTSAALLRQQAAAVLVEALLGEYSD
jgi:hypothetical protein